MAFPDCRRAFLSLMLLLLLVAPSVYSTQEHISKTAQQSQEIMSPTKQEEFKQSIKETLQEYNTIPIPGLPPINIPGDSVSISLSLADVYVQGLNDSTVEFTPGLLSQRAHVTVLLNKLSLFAGSYSSSGHILNLPFNGEGPMYLSLHGLFIDFSFKWFLIPKLCAKYNTTTYDLDLRRMETNFENLNLNEGSDLGQLVDIVVPSFGKDIVERLQELISTKYYQFFDSILIGLINKIVKCSAEAREDTLKTNELMELINDITRDFLP